MFDALDHVLADAQADKGVILQEHGRMLLNSTYSLFQPTVAEGERLMSGELVFFPVAHQSDLRIRFSKKEKGAIPQPVVLTGG